MNFFLDGFGYTHWKLLIILHGKVPNLMVILDPILPLFIILWKVLSGLTILMNSHQLLPFVNLTWNIEYRLTPYKIVLK